MNKESRRKRDVRTVVKRFVKDNQIPYTCLIGDEATLAQIPGMKGFPTLLVLDRAGKVRVLVTENQTNTMDMIIDVVEILLADPVLRVETRPRRKVILHVARRAGADRLTPIAGELRWPPGAKSSFGS